MFKTVGAFITLGILLFSLLLGSLFFSSHAQTPSRKPQVYDCFLFFNEFELLKIRLHEMAPYVDHFVIVEAAETFRGQPKPLLFETHQALFAEYAHKITYVPLKEHYETAHPMEREHFQRAQIMRGLTHCHNEDIILLSDLDEIVRRSSLPTLIDLLSTNKVQVLVCQQKMYQGYLNRYWDLWSGTVATRYKVAQKIGVKQMRKLRNCKPRRVKRNQLQLPFVLADAGWHFTSMGGIEAYIQKVEAYSHPEFDQPAFKEEENFKKMIQGKAWVPVDSTFPLLVQEQKHHLEELHFLDPGTQ